MNDFKYDINLRIRTKAVPAHQICTELHLTPKWIHVLGEQRKTPNGDLLDGVYKHNYLSFEFQYNIEEEISGALARILDELAPHNHLFNKICETGGETEFFIGWYSPNNTGDIFTWVLLQKLGEFKINLAFDIYGDSAL